MADQTQFSRLLDDSFFHGTAAADRDLSARQRIRERFGNMDMARRASNLSRYYATPSLEMVVSAAAAGFDFDMPLVAEVVRREQAAAHNSLTQWSVRNLSTVADSLWQQIPKLGRTGVRMAQGEAPWNAYMNAGSSTLGQMTRAKALGKDYDLGTGWFHQPQDPIDNSVIRQRFLELGEQQAQENPYGDLSSQIAGNWRQAVGEYQQQYVDVDRQRYQEGELTRFQPRPLLGGFEKQEAIPFTFGRALAGTVFPAEWSAFKWFSGGVDAALMVAVDPLNFPADELTRYVRSRGWRTRLGPEDPQAKPRWWPDLTDEERDQLGKAMHDLTHMPEGWTPPERPEWRGPDPGEFQHVSPHGEPPLSPSDIFTTSRRYPSESWPREALTPEERAVGEFRSGEEIFGEGYGGTIDELLGEELNWRERKRISTEEELERHVMDVAGLTADEPATPKVWHATQRADLTTFVDDDGSLVLRFTQREGPSAGSPLERPADDPLFDLIPEGVDPADLNVTEEGVLHFAPTADIADRWRTEYVGDWEPSGGALFEIDRDALYEGMEALLPYVGDDVGNLALIRPRRGPQHPGGLVGSSDINIETIEATIRRRAELTGGVVGEHPFEVKIAAGKWKAYTDEVGRRSQNAGINNEFNRAADTFDDLMLESWLELEHRERMSNLEEVEMAGGLDQHLVNEERGRLMFGDEWRSDLESPALNELTRRWLAGEFTYDDFAALAERLVTDLRNQAEKTWLELNEGIEDTLDYIDFDAPTWAEARTWDGPEEVDRILEEIFDKVDETWWQLYSDNKFERIMLVQGVLERRLIDQLNGSAGDDLQKVIVKEYMRSNPNMRALSRYSEETGQLAPYQRQANALINAYIDFVSLLDDNAVAHNWTKVVEARLPWIEELIGRLPATGEQAGAAALLQPIGDGYAPWPHGGRHALVGMGEMGRGVPPYVTRDMEGIWADVANQFSDDPLEFLALHMEHDAYQELVRGVSGFIGTPSFENDIDSLLDRIEAALDATGRSDAPYLEYVDGQFRYSRRSAESLQREDSPLFDAFGFGPRPEAERQALDDTRQAWVYETWDRHTADLDTEWYETVREIQRQADGVRYGSDPDYLDYLADEAARQADDLPSMGETVGDYADLYGDGLEPYREYWGSDVNDPEYTPNLDESLAQDRSLGRTASDVWDESWQVPEEAVQQMMDWGFSSQAITEIHDQDPTGLMNFIANEFERRGAEVPDWIEAARYWSPDSMEVRRSDYVSEGMLEDLYEGPRPGESPDEFMRRVGIDAEIQMADEGLDVSLENLTSEQMPGPIPDEIMGPLYADLSPKLLIEETNGKVTEADIRGWAADQRVSIERAHELLDPYIERYAQLQQRILERYGTWSGGAPETLYNVYGEGLMYTVDPDFDWRPIDELLADELGDPDVVPWSEAHDWENRDFLGALGTASQMPLPMHYRLVREAMARHVLENWNALSDATRYYFEFEAPWSYFTNVIDDADGTVGVLDALLNSKREVKGLDGAPFALSAAERKEIIGKQIDYLMANVQSNRIAKKYLPENFYGTQEERIRRFLSVTEKRGIRPAWAQRWLEEASHQPDNIEWQRRWAAEYEKYQQDMDQYERAKDTFNRNRDIGESRGKGWTTPTTWSTFADKRAGKRVMKMLQGTDDLSVLRKWLGSEFDLKDLKRIAESTDYDEIHKIMQDYYNHAGVMQLAPKVGVRDALAARVNRNGRNGLHGFTVAEDESRLGRYLRRQQAVVETGGILMDEWDPDGVFDHVAGYLDTIGMDRARKNEILGEYIDKIGEPSEAFRYLVGPQGALKKATIERLLEMGYDEDITRIVANALYDEQLLIREYMENIAGHRIDVGRDNKLRIYRNETEYVDLDIPVAVMEAQFRQRAYFLPDARQARKVTGEAHRLVERMRHGFKDKAGKAADYYPLKPDQDIAVRALLERTMAGWRSMALLRGGWPLRVLPDEFLRILASGYGNALTHPIEWIALGVSSPQMQTLATGNIGDFWDMQGLGSGAFRKAADGTPIYYNDRAYDNRGVSWGPASRTVNPVHWERGYATKFLQNHMSPMNRIVAERGVEDALTFLQSDEGKDIVRAAKVRAARRGHMADLSNPEVLKYHLELIDMELAHLAGGYGYYRDPNTGMWIDSRTGRSVQPPSQMSDDDLMAILQENGYTMDQDPVIGTMLVDPNGTLVDASHEIGFRNTLESRAAEFVDHGILESLDNNIDFYVADPGRQDIREGVATGQLRATRNVITDQEALDMLNEMEWNGLVQQYYDIYGHGPDTEAALAGHDADTLRDVIREEWGIDDVEVDTFDIFDFAGTTDVPLTELELAKLERFLSERVWPLDDDGVPIPQGVREPMTLTATEQAILSPEGQARYAEMQQGHPGYTAPETVKAPVSDRDGPPGRSGLADRFVDAAFFWIGEVPTRVVMRQPLTAQSYHKHLARHYIFAKDSVRQEIRQLVLQNDRIRPGVRKLFDDFLQQEMTEVSRRGWNLNDAMRTKLGSAEIDRLAMHASLQETKDLLYDLSRTSNFADAARIVFPFADAFFEVITRWARLMNPYLNNGQAITNWRRATQVGHATRREGWFDKDEFGNDVFTLPFNIPVGSGARWQAQVDPSSLFFIDPGNPRSFLSPGFGPVVQLPTAFVLPRVYDWLPDEVGDALQWAVYGDFPPPGTGTLDDLATSALPTFWKRAYTQIFSDLNSEDMANEVALSAIMLLLDDPETYGLDEAREAKTKADAQRLGSMIAAARLTEAAFFPALPRYEPQIRVTDALNSGAGETFISLLTLNREMNALTEYFGGDRDKARQAIWERFDLDSNLLFGGSVTLKPRPSGSKSFEWLENHPVLYEHADHTLMAFVPEFEVDPFSLRAWNAQEEGDAPARVDYDVDSIMSAASARGYNTMVSVISEEYDREEAVARRRYGYGTDKYRQRMDQLHNWRTIQLRNLHLQYVSGPTDGRIKRPTGEEIILEVLNIGTSGTAANRELAEVNPELVGFLEFFKEAWYSAVDRSFELGLAQRGRGYAQSWWLNQKITRPLEPGEQAAGEQLRNWFIQTMTSYVNTQMSDITARNGAAWYMENVVTNLMAGYDLTNPIVIPLTELPNG